MMRLFKYVVKVRTAALETTSKFEERIREREARRERGERDGWAEGVGRDKFEGDTDISLMISIGVVQERFVDGDGVGVEIALESGSGRSEGGGEDFSCVNAGTRSDRGGRILSGPNRSCNLAPSLPNPREDKVVVDNSSVEYCFRT
jgi:hypothetical protein